MKAHNGGIVSRILQAVIRYVGYAICAASVLVGLLVLLFQVYGWIQYGKWISCPLSQALSGFDLTSIYHPERWVGLAKIAQWLLGLPVWLYLIFVVPIIVLFFTSAILDEHRQK